MNLRRLAQLPTLLPLLTFAFVLSSCTRGAPLARVQPQLSGTTWTLVSQGPTAEQARLASSTKLTLAVEAADRISGSAGCNSFSGNYLVDGDKLTVSKLASTLKACADSNLMAQETRYLAALAKASSYELGQEGRTLRIYYDGGKGALNFVRQ